jgi:hypothetical protein
MRPVGRAILKFVLLLACDPVRGVGWVRPDAPQRPAFERWRRSSVYCLSLVDASRSRPFWGRHLAAMPYPVIRALVDEFLPAVSAITGSPASSEILKQRSTSTDAR